MLERNLPKSAILLSERPLVAISAERIASVIRIGSRLIIHAVGLGRTAVDDGDGKTFELIRSAFEIDGDNLIENDELLRTDAFVAVTCDADLEAIIRLTDVEGAEVRITATAKTMFRKARKYAAAIAPDGLLISRGQDALVAVRRDKFVAATQDALGEVSVRVELRNAPCKILRIDAEQLEEIPF